MSESGDYRPAPWAAAHNFADAKKDYLVKADRTYSAAVSAGVAATDLVPAKLVCEAEYPLVILCDVTGSMAEWPATIFSKLPYLEHEGKQYLGDDMEISFAAIGDGPCHDKYPLQVQPFVSGQKLKDSLDKLIHEKGGGGTSEESYDLAALYYDKNVEYPNAIRKPILIFIGDEGIYPDVDRVLAESICKVPLKDRVSSKNVFQSLAQKYAVYVIRKPYCCSEDSPSAREIAIREQWMEYLGADHVLSLPSAERVVDVIFGILGKESGKMDYFEKELKERQLKDKDGAAKVSVVLKSIHSIHNPASLKKLPPPAKAKSVTRHTKKPSNPPSIGSGPVSLRDEDD
jgi:hypothetical protein